MNKVFDEIEKLENLIDQDILVYYGDIVKKNFTVNGEHRLDQNDTQTIAEFMRNPACASKRASVCVVIQSSGGLIAEAIKIIDDLRRFYSKIDFVVMTYAGSAGAYLSLCGDILYMRKNAMLSDFGPQNWQASGSPQASLVSLYQALSAQLMSGTMKCIPGASVGQAILELGGPCVSGIQLVNGRMHGTPLAFGNIKQLIPDTVKEHTDIPAPGAKQMPYAADSFTKLNNVLRKKMHVSKHARVLLYKQNSAVLSY